jgi:hypothetical protein
MRVTLDVNELAHRLWELRGRPARSALDDWLAAERLRHQVIEEAAYFRWLNRGRPIGDDWADWFAAEAEVVSGRLAAERLRHQVIEEAAYFRWLNRGRPTGDPDTDWFAAEAEITKVIEEAAYFRWLNRGRPIGDPDADWFAAEAEVVSGGPTSGGSHLATRGGAGLPGHLSELNYRYVNALAYRAWTMPRWSVDSALDDWLTAQRKQVIGEASYFRWLNRGRPIGDPDADWFAAEAEVVSGRPADFRWWEERGQPSGDAWADWSAATAEAASVRPAHSAWDDRLAAERDLELEHTRVGGGAGPDGGPEQPIAEPDRYLVGELPSRVQAGQELSLIVSITTELPEPGLEASPLPALHAGPQGVQVTLIVRPDIGLLPLGELEQTVNVPQSGDCPPVRFRFRARAVGLSRVRVTSWLGGTFLAQLRLEVSIESEKPAADIQRRRTPVGELRADPGEVTLQVTSYGARYSFQLLSRRYLSGPVEAKSLTEKPGQAVERTVAMLRKMAGDASGYTPALAARWVRETGTGLWEDLVPNLIKERFWQLHDSITSFTIACDDDTVPWELLYPLTSTDDAGFLVEQFPVLRLVYEQCRSDRVLLGDARYVVPPGSPDNAKDEVATIRRILGQPTGPAIRELAELLDLLDAGSTGLLHFACHNTFSLETGGSSIKMDGGAFVPQLLNSAVVRHSLADRSPLIFVNACRSAGASAEYTRMMGWASQFMAAGAGAFIGTLWPVRSLQASLFASVFYDNLAAGADLGHASLKARQATKDDADPTWLAYTVYGDPTALSASDF